MKRGLGLWVPQECEDHATTGRTPSACDLKNRVKSFWNWVQYAFCASGGLVFVAHMLVLFNGTPQSLANLFGTCHIP